MLQTVRITAGLLGGALGLIATLVSLLVMPEPSAQAIPPLLLPMGLGSSIGIGAGVTSVWKPTTWGAALSWVGLLLLVVGLGLTDANTGFLFLPATAVLLIAAVLGLIRRVGPQDGRRWIEMGSGVLGGLSGMAATTFWLNKKAFPVDPDTGLAAEEMGRQYLFEVMPNLAAVAALLGILCVVGLGAVMVHAWRNTRGALMVLWLSTACLVLGAVIGVAILGILYAPAALLFIFAGVVGMSREPSAA